jgi:multidrug resistance efflux pump
MEKIMNRLNISKKTIIVATACFLIISCGVVGMAGMSMSKNEQAPRKIKQKEVVVTTIPVVTEDVAVSVSGYGQADPINIIEINPQVSGEIIEKTSFKQGEIVQKGAMLFKIDDTDYVNTMEKARIKVKLQNNQIEQLKISYNRDQGRLSAVKQNTSLARSNFLRLKSLYTNDRVGTLSSMDDAEQNYNSLLDTEKSLIKSIDLYPLQIAEAESNLADANSDLKDALLDVERCIVTAPFTGRIKEMSIETGAYITKGTNAITLADDKILEIQVSLSEKDAFEILGFGQIKETTDLNATLNTIECRVKTVTGSVSADLPASLHRAVKYDSASRTLNLAVRVLQDDPTPLPSTIPIMDGMFCKVSFKGRSIKDTVKIPTSVLNSDNTVYVARGKKLKTISVTKVMEDGDNTYISGLFDPRDQIIVTKLVNPIENALLNIANSAAPSGSATLAVNTGDI